MLIFMNMVIFVLVNVKRELMIIILSCNWLLLFYFLLVDVMVENYLFLMLKWCKCYFFLECLFGKLVVNLYCINYYIVNGKFLGLFFFCFYLFYMFLIWEDCLYGSCNMNIFFFCMLLLFEIVFGRIFFFGESFLLKKLLC